MELALSAVVVLILYISLTCIKKQKYKLPKGPAGLPFLGNVFQLVKDPHLKFSEWAKQYGKVYTINVASQPALLINDAKTMHEILGTMPSTGKYQIELFAKVFGGNVGLIHSVGSVYLEQKRFCIANLKQFGFGGGTQLEPLILHETDNFCAWIDKEIKENSSSHKGILLHKLLLAATGNTIWNMLTGEHHKGGESKMVQCIEQALEVFVQCAGSGLVFLPWLRYIIPDKSGYNRYNELINEMRGYVQEYIDKHKAARELAGPATGVNDMIDVYLQEIENCKDPNSEFYEEKGMQHLFYTAIALVTAGTETTASSTNWLIFYLVAYPEVQKKLHNEIDSELGSERSPSITDKKKLPYLEAVIIETLRKSSFFPYGIPHMLLDDLKYEDYLLPKGMILLANIYHANHHEEIWGDPQNFRPERFLEGSQEHKKNLRNSVASFQEGKRKCPGELMARDTMFLFAAKLLQKYSFHPEEGRDREEYKKSIVGFVQMAPKIGVVVKPRLNIVLKPS